MAANKLEFVPIELPAMKEKLQKVVDDLQEKDRIEVEAYLREEQTVFDCVYNVFAPSKSCSHPIPYS